MPSDDAKRKLGAMFLPELHQARWVERLVQLREEQRKATTEGERKAIETQITEHYKRRHDLEQTRKELEDGYEVRHYEIKHRESGAVLFAGDFLSLARCVETAVRAGTDLSGADLREADFTGANLGYGKFAGADLRDANFTRVNLYGADLAGADLDGAVLNHTKIAAGSLPQPKK